MVRADKRSGAEWVNFQYAPPRSTQPQHSSGGARNTQPSRNNNNNPSGRNNHNHQHNNHNREHRRAKEDRTVARRKVAAHFFYLHSSPDHTFALARQPLKHQSYTFQGSDEAVSWESVRWVKLLSPLPSPSLQPAHRLSQEVCPICLDSFTCARITKCGHCFCLPCLIHHVHAYMNNNYSSSTTKKDTSGPKCPCCTMTLHLDDLRPMQIASTAPPRRGERRRFVKLHRSKTCPVPFLPQVHEPRRSSPHSAPTSTDADAPYSRFTYHDPAVYLQMLTQNINEVKSMETYSNTDVMSRQLALEMLQKQIQTAVEEESAERVLMERFANANAGMYQRHPPQLLAAHYTVESEVGLELSHSAIPEDDDADNDDHHHCPSESALEDVEDAIGTSLIPHFRGYSIGSEVSHGHARLRGDSIASSTDGSIRSSGSTHPTSPGSMFLQDEEETAFYQAEDGQLCFLSGFNMKCLRADYSATLHEYQECVHAADGATTKGHKRLPLPDYVEGTVVEIESLHLTRDVRQRLRFLSHLPLFTDISLVEINLGHVLSPETKKMFKKEFLQRKQTRDKKTLAEKKADARQQREEEARINDRKARMQRIDPNDEFFALSVQHDEVSTQGEDFGPTLAPVHATRTPVPPVNTSSSSSSFSQICRASLAPGAQLDRDFPALGSSVSSSPPSRPSLSSSAAPWGIPKPGPAAPSCPKASDPAVVVSSTAITTTTAATATKKGKRGQRVVLFSTSAHKGGVY
jgi:hypothetical protein